MRMLESDYREKSFRKLNDHKKMELYRNLADTTAVANAEMIFPENKKCQMIAYDYNLC